MTDHYKDQRGSRDTKTISGIIKTLVLELQGTIDLKTEAPQ